MVHPDLRTLGDREVAEELDVERPDLNAIRNEFYEQLSSVRAIRQLQA